MGGWRNRFAVIPPQKINSIYKDICIYIYKIYVNIPCQVGEILAEKKNINSTVEKVDSANLGGPKSREWGTETIHGYDEDETSLIPYFSGQPGP